MLENAIPADGSHDESDALDTDLAHPYPGTAVLTVSGEIDTLTAPTLDSGLARLVADDAPTLVVDLSEVTFLASSGLAVLVEGARLADASGRRLRLVAEGRSVVRPLRITGTDQLFDLFGDREEALRS